MARTSNPRVFHPHQILLLLLAAALLAASGCGPRGVSEALEQVRDGFGGEGTEASVCGTGERLVATAGTPRDTALAPEGPAVGEPSAAPAEGLPEDAEGPQEIPDFGRDATRDQVGQMLAAAARIHGIPEDILKAVAWQESTWRPDASSFDGGHGKGVMQIDDRYHELARTDAVWDPRTNIDYGAKFLRGLYEETGSWERALKRYNGGSSYPPKIMTLSRQRPWSAVA